MPQFRRKRRQPFNRTKRGYAKRYKKGFRKVGPTNNLYRAPVPRTLQIATRRNTKQVLRFVSNQCFKVKPGGDVGGVENTFLRFRANSIYDINQGNSGNGSLNPPNTWTAQDPTTYGPTQATVNAEGWEEWKDRYAQFTVLGSKISVTYEPFGTEGGAVQVPSTVYINLAGNASNISTGTEMSQINKLPYTKRAGIVPSSTTSQSSGQINTSNDSNSGVRLYHHYSTKSFEGVADVADNVQLKGSMLSAPAIPAELSYFTVGIRNTIPTTAPADRMPVGLCRVKIEYIVLLTEPTSTNNVQAPAGMTHTEL